MRRRTIPKNKQFTVQCPTCKTFFIRPKLAKEHCGICGDGEERMFKEVKIGTVKEEKKDYGKRTKK